MAMKTLQGIIAAAFLAGCAHTNPVTNESPAIPEIERSIGSPYLTCKETKERVRLVERDEEGKLVARLSCLDGLPLGHDTWHNNGQLQLQESYKNGNLDGERKVWYSDGQQWQHERYLDGVMHGKQQWWHKDGKRWYELNFDNGREVGDQFSWYQNGQLGIHEKYIDGKKHGEQLKWFSTKIKASVEFFEHGIPHGPQNFWFPNGQKSIELNYDMGLLHGTQRAYDPAGNLIKEDNSTRGRSLKKLSCESSSTYRSII